jgi:MFS family permease
MGLTGAPPGRARIGGFDRRLLAPMILGTVLNPINSSMIAVSLIPIGVALGAPPSQTAWLVSALYLATAIGQPVMGRLVDMYGPRRLYFAGTALTGVAGTIGALAPSLGVLVAARVLLGIGTCAGYPAAMSLISSESRRTGVDSPTGVLTALTVAAQTVSVIGPALGGLLIGLGGWRTVFSINIPLSLAGLILGALRLPRTVPTAADPHRRRVSVDAIGIALFGTALTGLLLLLMSPRTAHWYLLVVTAVAAAGLAARELRVEDPFIDLRVLGGNAALLATYARNLLTFIVTYAYVFGFTQWLESGRGLHPEQAGLMLVPMFLTGIAAATATGRRSEVRGKLLVGGVAQVAACATLLLLHSGTAIWLLVGESMLMGIPQGLLGLANQNALYYQADPARIGSSAGLLRTFMYLGAMSAAAANAGFYAGGADTAGMHDLAGFMLAVSAVFLLVTVFDRALARVGGVRALRSAA